MDPETWGLIWLVATVVLVIGEIAVTGAFFFLPFAAGAFVAMLLGFFGVHVGIQWLAFLVVSFASFRALKPLAERLNAQGQTEGIGSRRLIGEPAKVIETIPHGPHALGLVRVDREEWRAESSDGTEIAADTDVVVIEVRGTRAVVERT